jgi:hypothetical protein
VFASFAFSSATPSATPTPAKTPYAVPEESDSEEPKESKQSDSPFQILTVADIYPPSPLNPKIYNLNP